MSKIQRTSLLGGIAASVLCLLGLVTAREQFFISYLFAYLFWFGIAAGALGILLVHQVTGGAWGDLIRPQLNAAVLTLPLLGALFLPILGGLPVLFPWARPALVAADPILRHKHLYLNSPFFCLRALFYFGLWTLMARRLNRWSASTDLAASRLAQRLSAPGLVLYALTMTFAVLDWMMSLEPHWYSTIYEVLVIIGQILSAFAFTTVVLRRLQPSQDLESDVNRKPYWDLGNMTLAFVMIWAYMAFSQYLIIWSGNMPDEIAWYLHRQAGGWFWIAMTLVIFQFFLPFIVLLGRRNKQNLGRLARVAALIFVVSILNTFWLIEPTFFPGRLHVHWLDLAAFAALGGLWLAAFLTQIRKQPAPVGIYVPEAAE